MAYISFQPKDYFNTKLYTGNATGRTISGIGFKPDWVWGKSRTNTENHSVFDAVRGAGYDIKPDSTNAQASNTGITAFNSDGYVLGTADSLNSNGQSFVTWNWKANGQGSANTSGSINTTYTSVDNTAGFSISSYTGTGSNATIGTGLTSKPACVMIKNLTDGSTEWMIGHQGLATNAFSSNKYIHFNTAATATNSSSWNSTEPTSNGIVSLGNGSYLNGSSKNYICYAFTEKQGFSKFGKYTGNGNVDGPFIHTGFKPAWILFRDVRSGQSWNMYDNKRSPINFVDERLRANLNGAEVHDTGYSDMDFLSNGFKLRRSWDQLNASGQTIIYMAFAEAPLVGSNNIPATAR